MMVNNAKAAKTRQEWIQRNWPEVRLVEWSLCRPKTLEILGRSRDGGEPRGYASANHIAYGRLLVVEHDNT